MPQTMTLDEKLATLNKATELEKSGDIEEADLFMISVPILPYLAKAMKEKVGIDYLINGGWNLSEAEIEFGNN